MITLAQARKEIQKIRGNLNQMDQVCDMFDNGIIDRITCTALVIEFSSHDVSENADIKTCGDYAT